MNRETEASISQPLPCNKPKIEKNTSDDTSQKPIKPSSPIISFSGKKRKLRFSLRRLILPLISLFLAFLLLSAYFESKLGPRMAELAETQAQKHLQETVNLAIEELAKAKKLTYHNMVRTIRDSKGEVIYLEVNTSLLSEVKAMLVSAIDRKLEENKKITLSLPFGALTGWNLFSGLGFPLRVRIFPIGMTEGEIFTALEDCGINQTRHLIQVKIKAEMLIVLPGENPKVETEVTLPLGERVLVGEVPEIYLDTLGAG